MEIGEPCIYVSKRKVQHRLLKKNEHTVEDEQVN